ncbi:MAG: hypothetical protein Q8Q35_00745 [Nanoarchaeota archaeon]|nr:hypothetical protein [Nanoarchaeota archaeon]
MKKLGLIFIFMIILSSYALADLECDKAGIDLDSNSNYPLAIEALGEDLSDCTFSTEDTTLSSVKVDIAKDGTLTFEAIEEGEYKVYGMLIGLDNGEEVTFTPEGAVVTLNTDSYISAEKIGFDIKVEDQGVEFIIVNQDEIGLASEKMTLTESREAGYSEIDINDVGLSVSKASEISYIDDQIKTLIKPCEGCETPSNIFISGYKGDDKYYYTIINYTKNLNIYSYDDIIEIEALADNTELNINKFTYTLNKGDVLSFIPNSKDDVTYFQGELEVFEDRDGTPRNVCGNTFSTETVFGEESSIEFKIESAEDSTEDSTCKITSCYLFENKEIDGNYAYTCPIGNEIEFIVEDNGIHGLICEDTSVDDTISSECYCNDKSGGCLEKKDVKMKFYGQYEVENIKNFKEITSIATTSYALIADEFDVAGIEFRPDSPLAYFSSGSLIVEILDGVVRTDGLRERFKFKEKGSYKFEIDKNKLIGIDCCAIKGDKKTNDHVGSNYPSYGCHIGKIRNNIFIKGEENVFLLDTVDTGCESAAITPATNAQTFSVTSNNGSSSVSQNPDPKASVKKVDDAKSTCSSQGNGYSCGCLMDDHGGEWIMDKN